MEKGMNFWEEYSIFIGILLLVFMIIILLSTPSLLIAKTITTVDTELSHASGNEFIVRTLMDFGSNEHIAAFPTEIGDWRGADYETSQLKERLDADVMLLRVYYHEKIRQSVFFHILQSNNRSSFHPPIACYPALGYTIKDEATEEIFIHNASWASKPLFVSYESEKEKLGGFNFTLSAKKLIVTKESEGKVKERRVVLYYYVKDNPLVSNAVTIVRVSTHAPTEGSYEGSLNICRDFMGDSFSHMFEFRQGEDIIAVSLAKNGLVGWAVIAILLALPCLIIIYPQVKKEKE